MTFGRPSIEDQRNRRAIERAANLRALMTPARTLHRAVMGGCTSGIEQVKSKPKRNATLLEMARGRRCLLCGASGCICRPGSVVACHSNLAIHGKAKGRKADDCWSVWGGDTMHRWLDQGGAVRALKERVFMEAHERQVQAWREIAGDAGEPARFRKAARWALEQLEVQP